jgi:transposase
MASDLEDLKRRLVVGHKRGGRCIYDESAKAELVQMCRQPGASVSRLARECGINANQVSRWLREEASQRKRSLLPRCAPVATPFVAVPVLAPAVTSPAPAASQTLPMSLQARLPNGVTVELHGADLRQLGEAIQALGRLPCSA